MHNIMQQGNIQQFLVILYLSTVRIKGCNKDRDMLAFGLYL